MFSKRFIAKYNFLVITCDKIYDVEIVRKLEIWVMDFFSPTSKLLIEYQEIWELDSIRKILNNLQLEATLNFIPLTRRKTIATNQLII